MGKVIHFEIHADDPERAMSFYRELLGWRFEAWGGLEYWLATTGPDAAPGIHGALTRRDAPPTGDGYRAFVCVAAVDDVRAALARVPELGGRVVMGVHAVPGVGWHAYVDDPEGNRLGLMQEDPSAA